MASKRAVRLQNESLAILRNLQAPTATQWMPEAFTPEAALPGASAAPFQYNPGYEYPALQLAPTTGELSPWEAAVLQDPSIAAQAKADPAGVQAQLEALKKSRVTYGQLGGIYGDFRDIYNQGGMTAIDRARWEEAKNRNLQMARGQREATLQNMEQRGLGGSGIELASILSGQEGANIAQSAESLGIEAQAQQRAIDALMGASNVSVAQGNIANQIGTIGYNRAEQQFQEEYDTGTAADQVNKSNTEGLRAREVARAKYIQDTIRNDTDAARAANIGNTDWARENYKYDVGAHNNAAFGNVNAKNATNQYYNIEEPWRRYGAEAQKATAFGNQANNAAGQAEQASQTDREFWGNIIGEGTKSAAGLFSFI